jgi:hypothetical protein
VSEVEELVLGAVVALSLGGVVCSPELVVVPAGGDDAATLPAAGMEPVCAAWATVDAPGMRRSELPSLDEDPFPREA